MTERISNNRNLIVLIAAFAAVYVFWGSTYLAIKYSIETLPPFLMAGSRFAFAGGILYVWGRLSKDSERPKLVHWKTAFVVGTFLLLGGNGGVVIASNYISSSMAALLVATEPFWIVLLSWLWLGNGRPGLKVVLGLLVGFAGVWMLIAGRAPSGDGRAQQRRCDLGGAQGCGQRRGQLVADADPGSGRGDRRHGSPHRPRACRGGRIFFCQQPI